MLVSAILGFHAVFILLDSYLAFLKKELGNIIPGFCVTEHNGLLPFLHTRFVCQNIMGNGLFQYNSKLLRREKYVDIEL